MSKKVNVDDAIQRLTSWIGQYGDEKQRIFIEDLSVVLLVARDSARLQKEVDSLSHRNRGNDEW